MAATGVHPAAILWYATHMDIAERNRIRAEARLPLLDIAAETKRLEDVRQEAEFEAVWERRRIQFQKWIEGGQGYFPRMGRFSIARQQVRKEMCESQID